MTMKLNPTKVRLARRLRAVLLQRSIGKILGVAQNTISRAQTRTTWRDVR